MAYDSTKSRTFLATLQHWIESSGEILVMIRYNAAAGDKSFEFFSSFDLLQRCLDSLPSRTCVIAFHDRQLPLRGTMDERFITEASRLVPEGQEWLLAALKLRVAGGVSWFHHMSGTTHKELREALDADAGEPVAFGPYPPWLRDSEVVVSAVVPDADGTVVCGIY